MVAQVNKTREATMSHYNKLLDESRARQKTMEDCLAKTENDARSDFDSERCKQEHLEALLGTRNAPQDAQIQIAESRLKVKFIRKEELN